jgi:hypothetical protein
MKLHLKLSLDLGRDKLRPVLNVWTEIQFSFPIELDDAVELANSGLTLIPVSKRRKQRI